MLTLTDNGLQRKYLRKRSCCYWVVPNTCTTYTVTVTVTDARGDEATESISIIVSCGCR